MNARRARSALLLTCALAATAAHGSDELPAGTPITVIDLATEAGVGVVRGAWRYSDTRIVEVDFKAPGPDGQPTGAPIRTYDFTPHAGGREFDDSSWPVIAADELAERRSTGRLCFNWYRLRLTVPSRIAGIDPTGATLVFETSVDDYAEVWVDGELSRALGQSGGSVIAGWNAPNRLVIGRNVQPGQEIQLAVFGVNGPISNPVTNYIWMRTARLEVHSGAGTPSAFTPREVNVEVDRVDPALDAIVPPNPKIWKLAEGLDATERPVWLEGSPVFDRAGNGYALDPSGVRIQARDGRHLGTIRTPRLPTALAWGDEDRRTLYLTARDGLYRTRLGVPGQAFAIERKDPRLDALVPRDARVEKVADGFTWLEGPVWSDGRLLFSDIPSNSIFRWASGEGATLFLRPSGYSGAEPFAGREPGSNGLALDREGRLIVCEHGDRRITRIERDGTRTVLADRYQGRRLNSPNDVVLRSNGDLYFTDPPFGLAGAHGDPDRELSFSGVYRLSADGELTLLTDELRAPNGIAFSPDERTLYVSDAVPERPRWMAYPVLADGRLGPGKVFFDATPWTKLDPGSADGIEVDQAGNLFAAGPGGIFVLDPRGDLLGRIRLGVATSNSAWGDTDGHALYVTASSAIYRIRLPVRGKGSANSALSKQATFPPA